MIARMYSLGELDSLLVVEEIMRQVIANVPEDASAVYGCRRKPVVEKDGVS